MSPIKRGGVYYLYVRKERGGNVLRTTQTRDPLTYRLMRAMLARLVSERRWSLLHAIATHRLTIGQVFDADRTKALDALDASLHAQALAPHVTAYLTACRARGLAARNVENVARQLTAFLTVATTTADLTTATVTAWLSSLTTSPGTRRQYLYAVTGFTRYLCAVGVLAHYPLSSVQAPKKNASRMTYMSQAIDQKIVGAALPQYRALFAFIKATGCDVSTALAMRARDIDLTARTARLKGTKTATRDVHDGVIEAWAIPVLGEYLALHEVMAQGPNAHLWPTLTRSGAYHHHVTCCTAVGVEDYTLKDSRHSVAVRMAKAGYTVFEIAEQLGTSPELVARVYARFIPKMSARVTPDVTQAEPTPGASTPDAR